MLPPSHKQNLNRVKLAVVLAQPFWYDGQMYTTRQPFALFVASFAKYVNRLVLFVPLKLSKSERGEFQIYFHNNVKIIGFPFYDNTHDLYKRSYKIIPSYINIFLKNINKWDLCWIIDTNVISFVTRLLTKWKSKCSFLYLRANLWKNIINQEQTKLGKLKGYCLAVVEEIFIRIMIQNTLVFTIGNELFRKYLRDNNTTYCFYTNLLSEKIIIWQRKKIKKYNDKLNLLVVGRLVPQKGLDYFIEAVDKLVNKHSYNIKCHIVGKGCDENRLKNLIANKGLHQHIKLLGHIAWGDKLFDIYRNSGLFILPSITEGFPKTVFEAMAFGLPVIATDVGGISGIIKHKFNGMVVVPRSSDALVNAICEICNDEKMYEAIKENGYETAKEFTIEKQMRKMQDIIYKHFGESNEKNHML